jgi:hypothetical protein
MNIQITMSVDKVTKGAIRYAEKDAEGKATDTTGVGAIYIRKTTLGSTPPESIKVTIEG